MQEPRITENEAHRLDALHRLEVLDRPAEEHFDRLTRIAQRHFRVPIALVSLVDAQRQWFKSRQGLDACETSRGISFCGHAILAEDIFCVPNALDDPRFADNPLVTGGPRIRFYAGAPLHAPGGQRIGTLCIIDAKPRAFSLEELSVLRDLADSVEAELERSRLLEAARESARLAMVAERTDNAVVITDAQGLIEWVNQGFERISGYMLAEVVGKKPGEVLQGPDTDPETLAFMREKIRAGEAFGTEVLNYHKNGTPYWLALSIQPIHDDQGSLTRFIAIESDITERKQNERRIQEQNRLLDAISRAQSRFIRIADIRQTFDGVLKDLLELTASEYGFIGNVLHRADGSPYLKTYALTNIAWNEKTRLFYEENAPKGLEFCNLDTLFGAAMKTGQAVIANDPSNDPRRGGLPPGHPPLDAFLGLPICLGSKMVGMVGLANRAGGYDQALIDYLSPLMGTLGTLVEAIRNERRRRDVNEELSRFKHILDNTLDMIFMYDAKDLRFVYVNQGALQSMGYSREELLLLHPYDIKPLVPESAFRQLIAPMLAGEQNVLHFETIHRRKDGSVFPVEIFLQLVRDANGPGRFIAIVCDITERKRIEAEIRASENRLRAVIETVVDGIITINDNGIIQTANPATAKTFGYGIGEMLGRNINMLMPEPYHSAHDGYLHCYLSTGKRKIIGIGREVAGRRKDGSTFAMELAVSEMEINGERMFTGIVRDISERKLAEAQLHAVIALRKAILDSANFSIISTNPDGLILTFSQGAERLLGYMAEEIVGKQTPAILHDLDEVVKRAGELSRELGREVEPGFEAFVAKARLGVPDEREWTYIRKDGSRFPVLLSITALWDVQGEISGFLGIGSDITERKKLDRMKSEFVSTVSHELRTPLTSIRGALGLVLGKAAGQLPEMARSMLEMAERNSERLTLLINDLLDLEKIESGRLEFDFKTVDLVAIAKRALADNEGYARKHAVSLTLDMPLEQAPVRGDEHRLLQVFANLISNAVKYSLPDGVVEVSVASHAGGFRVAVRDHGQGIPEEFRARMFQRFAQADSSDSREKGGTGLGLSITRAIVEHHAGHIGYDSEVGRGTVFHFDLPAMQAAITERSGSETGVRVLICEDNPDVATILAEMLKPEGLISDIAATAAMARTLLARHPYRLLLLDLTLPDADGLQFLQELRGVPATADLPVIVVSGRAQEGRAAFSGDALAVVDWLQKPLDRERLERALREALQRAERPRILHVEDDVDIVQVTQVLLEDLADLSHVASLRGARELLASQDFDLVLLDLGLADGSGVELMDELKGRCPVVIFSAQVPGREITELVAAALTKSMTSNYQLLATIKKILQG